MAPEPTDRRRRILAALLALLLAAAGLVAALIGDDSEPPTAAPAATTVTIGPPDERTKIVLPPAAEEIVEEQAAEDAAGHDAAAEADLREPAPPTPAQSDAAEEITPPGQPEVPEAVPQAAPYNAGCRYLAVRNQSSRGGEPILLGVIHWTGSRNLFGTADGLAIVRWFDTPASQSSSHYITDDEGRCWYIVPESANAWTQVRLNRFSLSVEIINQGVQPLFGARAGRDRVLSLMRGWHARWRIPYRRGAIDLRTCIVTRTGFLAHRDLGWCGGAHPDVGTFDLDGLIREAAMRPITGTDRRMCTKVRNYRLTRRAGRTPSAAWTRAHRRRLERVRAHGLRCVEGKPRRRV